MATSNDNSVPAGFKEIPGYDGRYFINEHGDIWSAFKKSLMSPQVNVFHPYPWVLLRKNGKSRPTTIYYLMRLTWMPPAPGEVGIKRDEWCVNHKDGNKSNSHIDNLEWMTSKENHQHAWDTGLFEGKRLAKSKAVIDIVTGKKYDALTLACTDINESYVRHKLRIWKKSKLQRFFYI